MTGPQGEGEEDTKQHELVIIRRRNGGEEAPQALNITKKQWQELGEIANGRPVEQSRHRGQHVAARRPAAQRFARSGLQALSGKLGDSGGCSCGLFLRAASRRTPKEPRG